MTAGVLVGHDGIAGTNLPITFAQFPLRDLP